MKRDFLHITDFTRDEIFEVFQIAAKLKMEVKKNIPHHHLKGKSMAMIFQKPSSRTRISFEIGLFQLGGHALYLSPNDIGMGKREAVKDIAQLLSRYNDFIMARVFGHSQLIELGMYSTIPVINGLSDLNHPCQVMGDMFTILEYRKNFDGLKVAYIGDGNNVAYSWLEMAMRIPITVAIASPKGYEVNPAIVEEVKKNGMGKVILTEDKVHAAEGADVVYTDVWASMGQESESEKRNNAFRSYQITSDLMRVAKKDAKFMHCLPAHRESEVSAEVLDGAQSIVFDEAENRLHIQKAIILKLAGISIL